MSAFHPLRTLGLRSRLRRAVSIQVELFMSVSAIIIGAALSQSAPAATSLPPLLIPRLQLGLRKEQVKAIWPKMAASFGNGCAVKIEAGYQHGELDFVTLRPTTRDKGGACTKLLTEWAHYSFGKPTSEYGIPPNLGNCVPNHYGALGPMSVDPGCETSEGVQFTRWETTSLTVLLKMQGDDWTVTASRP